MSKANILTPRRAVILTALPAEFNAVRAHLTALSEEVYKGTIYERGTFSVGELSWEIGIVEVGVGNDSAAFEAERAITHFEPSVALFVGVAGGVKEVRVGDVVAATRVYGYESGKAEQTFKPRPDVGNSSHPMVHRARAEARRREWLRRVIGPEAVSPPRTFVGPIAAGEKVIATTESELFQFLRSAYNDTLAVEMEGRGFLETTHANPQVMALIVRGISDLINDKSDLDDANRQEIASRHASAFAFEVLAKLDAAVVAAEPIAEGPVAELGSNQGEAIAKSLPSRRRAKRKLRVALLYKRNAQPDDHVLDLLEENLSVECEVFLDRHLCVGVEWAKEIKQKIRTADAVVPLLSTSSIQSEMLTHEVEIACEAYEQNGRPSLLPVRVCYEGPLPEPLAAILNPLQQASWTGPQDDQRLTDEIYDALQSPNRPLTQKLEAVGGAVPLDSAFYITRPVDQEFLEALKRGDSIVLIKGARQMGKTSLLARGLDVARTAGARVVMTDLQKLNAGHLSSTETLFQALGGLIGFQLGLNRYPEDTWNSRHGPNMNFERYLRTEVLDRLNGDLVWGLDEVDRLFNCVFADEVFGLFRSWHNERSLDPRAPWQRLTMAMAYATEAHLFIKNPNQSPFNVGTPVTLEDFTLEQVAQLNQRYGGPLRNSIETDSFYKLLGGHPYLARRGLNEMAQNTLTFAGFEERADLDDGPFGDHLRRLLVILAQDAALCEVMRKLLQGRAQPSGDDFYRLRSAGLLSGHNPQEARLRCRLYETYFKRHLT
jgi:nucleoside phosphorylase